jgi:hypothetical protein
MFILCNLINVINQFNQSTNMRRRNDDETDREAPNDGQRCMGVMLLIGQFEFMALCRIDDCQFSLSFCNYLSTLGNLLCLGYCSGQNRQKDLAQGKHLVATHQWSHGPVFRTCWYHHAHSNTQTGPLFGILLRLCFLPSILYWEWLCSWWPKLQLADLQWTLLLLPRRPFSTESGSRTNSYWEP